ncbi:MAG TPA: FkbM family methyltransferase [Stellaceae bacterium]|nr:FkbM family methyltransferase [Stellaceae bacterium]
MLQSLKDAAIGWGLEPVLRPVWNRMTRHVPFAEDAQLFALLALNLAPDAVCVDVGAHKGLILDACRRAAPQGRFHAVEPLPRLAALLRRKYRRDRRVSVYQCALAAEPGMALFHLDRAEPGRSGFKRRDPARAYHVLPVVTARFDDLFAGIDPDFIKIDVEGAELAVLLGARETLRRARPLIVFEHGQGGAEFYGTRPEAVFDLLDACGYRLSPLAALAAPEPLSRARFVQHFDEHTEYYFVAYP